MLGRITFVILLIVVVVQAESPWRRQQRGQWLDKRGFPEGLFERDSMKRGETCDYDFDCPPGYYCHWWADQSECKAMQWY